MTTATQVMPGPSRSAVRARRLWMRIGLTTRGPAFVVLILTGLFVLAPAVIVFVQAFTGSPSGTSQLFSQSGLGILALRTFELAVGSGVLAMIMGVLLAWCAGRLPWRLQWLGSTPFLPLVVPQLAMVTGYVFLLNSTIGYANQIWRSIFGGTIGPINPYTLPWMIVLSSFVLTSLVFLFVRTALSQMNQELVDAGAVFGCGPIRVLWSVVLPVMRPALTYSAITVLLLSMGQITVPLIFGHPVGFEVLGTAMYDQTGQDVPNLHLAAAYGLPILVVGLAAIAFQRIMLRDQGRFITAGRGTRAVTEKFSWVGCGILVVYALVSLILPLISIALVSLQPFWSGHVVISQLSLHNYSLVFSTPTLSKAVTDSFEYAAAAALIGIPVTHACARIIYANRRMPWIASLQDLIVNMPLIVPTVVFGLGFLLLYTQTPFGLYGEGIGVVILWVVLILPITTRLQLAALVNLGDELNAAASTCGAGFMRRLLTIDLPLLRPALAGGAALIMVVAMQEFTATIFVASTNTQVMGTQIYQLFSFVGDAQAAALAIIMTLVTTIGVLIAFTIGGRGVRGSSKRSVSVDQD